MVWFGYEVIDIPCPEGLGGRGGGSVWTLPAYVRASKKICPERLKCLVFSNLEEMCVSPLVSLFRYDCKSFFRSHPVLLKLPDLTQNRPDPLLLPGACNSLFPVVEVYWASQVVYSIFFLVWNLLVAVVLVSVARTQTIRIRRWGLGPKQFF